MRLLYYNESFSNLDGSSQHALGLSKGLRYHKKIERLYVFPIVNRNVNHHATSLFLKRGFSVLEQILRFLKRALQSVYRYRQFLKIRNYKPTIILARASPFDLTPLLISRKLNIPLVAEWNSPFFYEIEHLRKGSLILLVKNWERKFLQSSDVVYTVSNQVKNLLVKEYNLPAEKLYSIPNGFDSDLYPNNVIQLRQQSKCIRKKYGWNDKTVIVFIGSLKKWHGIEKLIKIADYFSRKDQSILFLVIGDGEGHRTIKLANKRFRNFLWMGSLSYQSMAYYLSGCDLGIMPYSQIDGFYFSPLKLYDMIGACLPSIGHSNGQLAEVYNEYPEVGWGLKKGLIKEYIDLIEHLQRNKFEIDTKRDCLATTRFNHTWKVRADNLVKLIEPISKN